MALEVEFMDSVADESFSPTDFSGWGTKTISLAIGAFLTALAIIAGLMGASRATEMAGVDQDNITISTA